MELMTVLGHLVQILHILLIVSVMYIHTRLVKWWIGPTWLLIVLGSGLFTGGVCPLTVLSNTLLESAGGKEYTNLLMWLADFIGVAASITFFVFAFVGPLLAGWLVRRKRLRTVSLQQQA